jgi:RNase H-like domain found in reverse transcriptase
LNYKAPTQIKEGRQLMGMANFYSRFIDGFSGIIAPISDLLKGVKKGEKPQKGADDAFKAVKSKLITSPILANPDFGQSFTIQTDASDNAIKAVLTQQQEGEERVIAFFSKKLTTAQKSTQPPKGSVWGYLWRFVIFVVT